MFSVTNNMQRQRGAVSIFIVIFTALLVTVVTTSFVQIMLRNQQQASDNDLSQSAYDSALAGVEDAKRALVLLKKCQRNSATPGVNCANLQTTLRNANDCEVLGNTNVGVSAFNNGEVQVGAASQNQAYTCVKVKVLTESYEGLLLNQDDTSVVPLLPVGDPNLIQAVRLSWFTKSDLPVGATTPTIPFTTTLPKLGAWDPSARTPPIMRAQLMQFNNLQPINLTAFDQGNARTKFLYPFTSPILPASAGSFAADDRRNNASLLNYGGCRTNFDAGGYACSVDISLPAMNGGERREAYMQLASIYNTSTVHYKVELLNSVGSINVVNFDNVQPEVDSTGRSSDLFRRIKARVTVTPSGTPLPFPDAPVTTKDLCKEFFITNSPVDYNGNGNGDGDLCTPS